MRSKSKVKNKFYKTIIQNNFFVANIIFIHMFKYSSWACPLEPRLCWEFSCWYFSPVPPVNIDSQEMWKFHFKTTLSYYYFHVTVNCLGGNSEQEKLFLSRRGESLRTGFHPDVENILIIQQQQHKPTRGPAKKIGLAMTTPTPRRGGHCQSHYLGGISQFFLKIHISVLFQKNN